MARIQDSNSNPIFDEVQAIQFTLVTLNSEASVVLHGHPVVAIQAEAFSGTLTFAFEGSVDNGGNYRPITAINSGDGSAATGAAGDGMWFAPVGGLSNFRVRVDTWTSGQVTISVRAGYGAAASYTPFSGDVTVPLEDGDGDPITDDVNDSLRVSIISGGGGTEYADGAVRGTATGVLAMGDDGVNVQSVKVDVGGVLAVQDNGGSITVDAATLPLPTGAATSALQLPDGHNVTVDNAAGASAVNVQDGGNSLTVDATSLPLPTGAATSALQTQPGVDIGDVTVNNGAAGAAVNIQDGGNSITVDGSVALTGTVDTELPAAAALADNTANPTVPGVGAFMMAFDGTNWDRVQTGAAATGSLKVDGSAVTQPVSAASLPLPTGAATSALQTQPGVDIGDVTINNAAGASAVNVQDGGNSITVDGTVAVSGAVDTELPAAAALADAAANPTAPAVGAFGMVWNGATWDRLMGDVNGVEVQGAAAHDAAVAGRPVLLGVEARTTNPVSVSDGDAVRVRADKSGRIVTTPSGAREQVTQNNITLTTTTETSLLAAGGAGVFHDLTAIIVSNTSGTAVRVDFRDATAGTVRFSLMIAANGGGGIFTPPVPVKMTTANNAWTAQLSAAVTDVRIFAQAVANL